MCNETSGTGMPQIFWKNCKLLIPAYSRKHTADNTT